MLLFVMREVMPRRTVVIYICYTLQTKVPRNLQGLQKAPIVVDIAVHHDGDCDKCPIG